MKFADVPPEEGACVHLHDGTYYWMCGFWVHCQIFVHPNEIPLILSEPLPVDTVIIDSHCGQYPKQPTFSDVATKFLQSIQSGWQPQAAHRQHVAFRK